jgi:GNAT superfamily N-acetyltransferase
MIYRVADIKDINEILHMKNEVKQRVINQKLPIWNNGYPLDSMIIEDVEANEGRVVELDGKIVAYAVFHHRSKEYDISPFKEDNVQCFGRVMVRDGYTGMHIGDFLVKSMIEEAKTLDVVGMGITADNCNVRAVNLYTKHGFKKEGEAQFPYAYLDIFGLYF